MSSAFARALVATCAMVACAETAPVRLVFPSEAELAIVLHGTDARLLRRDASPLRFEDDGRTLAVLFYREDPESLGLSADSTGRLERARSDDPPEDVWPLPPPLSGKTYDASTQVFIDANDSAALAESVRVPALPCGGLTRLDSVRVDALDGLPLANVALVGDTVAITTEQPREPIDGRLFVVSGGETRELTSALGGPARARTRVFPDGDAFFVIKSSSVSVAAFRVSPAGDVTRRAEHLANEEPFLNAAAHPAGTLEVFSTNAAERRVHHVDLARGSWTELPSLPPAEIAENCTPFVFQLSSSLEPPRSFIVGFAGLPPHRFSADAGPAPIARGLGPAAPCQSAYARFGSGVELSLLLAGQSEGGSYLVDGVWRPSSNEPWRVERFPVALKKVQPSGASMLGIDVSARSELVLVTHEPRRPDRRPRVCAVLGVGNVYEFALDGDSGVVLSREHANAPTNATRFRIERP